MSLDVNVDFRYGEGYPAMLDAHRYGIGMVRCISLPDNEAPAAAMLSDGVRVLAIYTGESDKADRYVMRHCSALQIGNEPQFAMNGDASWPTGDADDFVNVWHHVSQVLVPAVHPNGLPLVGPGIWAQDYAKWALVAHRLPGLSASAVHVYNLAASSVRFYLTRFRSVRADLALLCTEWLAREPDVLGIARAIDAYCERKLWFTWGPGVAGHMLYGTPELGILAMAA